MRAYDALCAADRGCRDCDAPAVKEAWSAVQRALASDAIRPRHVIDVTIPLATSNEANARSDLFRSRHRRARNARDLVPCVLRAKVSVKPPPAPARITLTRVAATQLDPRGVHAALKSVEDAVALDYFGIDDSDPRLLFVCEQTKKKGGPPEVRVRIEWGFGPT